MKRAVIYVPGLGDRRSRGQRVAIWCWRIYGVRSEVVRMQWHVAEPLDTKLGQLLQRIDALHEAGYAVSLVGVSAGAGAVVHAFARRQEIVSRVVCLCGKLQHPETISESTYRHNPAFAESLALLPRSLDALADTTRSRVLSIRPLTDSSVPPEDTVVPGFETTTIPSRGHAVSIGLGITLFSPLIIGFIRRSR